MKEKINSLLQAKFAGERKDGLKQLAASLALTIDTEEEAQKVIEKLTTENVGDFIKEWRKEADMEISKANNTYGENLKLKYNFTPKESGTPPAPPSTDVAEIIKKALEPLTAELNQLKARNSIGERKAKLIKELEVLDEPLRNPFLQNFDKLNFDSDDDFNAHLETIKGSVSTIHQSLIDKGLSMQDKPMFPVGKGKTEEDAFVDQMKAINEIKKEN